MTQEALREKLYQKYIEPTRHKEKDYIGIEIEMPILNLNKEAVDFSVLHDITDLFMKEFDFHVDRMDDYDNIYAVLHEPTNDIFSYDCSYNNLELSLGKAENIQEIEVRFKKYYTFLQNCFKKYNYTLTGMGVNPYRSYNNNVPIPCGRYRMLYHFLSSYQKYTDVPMYFHKYTDYGFFACASQVQLDIKYEDLLETINTFSKLEPFKAVLFSNSVLYDEEDFKDVLCCRDMFWENSTHGINPHNIGMFDYEFKETEELLDYISSTSMFCTERDGKYIDFRPTPVTEYFAQDEITGEYFDRTIESHQNITFSPEDSDLDFLRTYKFNDLTYRGTIEFRSCCTQPMKDNMTIAAFHLGLKKNLKKLTHLLDNDTVIYQHGYNATELRKLLIKANLPDFVDEDAKKLLELDSLTSHLVEKAEDRTGWSIHEWGAFRETNFQNIEDFEFASWETYRVYRSKDMGFYVSASIPTDTYEKNIRSYEQGFYNENKEVLAKIHELFSAKEQIMGGNYTLKNPTPENENMARMIAVYLDFQPEEKPEVSMKMN